MTKWRQKTSSPSAAPPPSTIATVKPGASDSCAKNSAEISCNLLSSDSKIRHQHQQKHTQQQFPQPNHPNEMQQNKRNYENHNHYQHHSLHNHRQNQTDFLNQRQQQQQQKMRNNNFFVKKIINFPFRILFACRKFCQSNSSLSIKSISSSSSQIREIAIVLGVINLLAFVSPLTASSLSLEAVTSINRLSSTNRTIATTNTTVLTPSIITDDHDDSYEQEMPIALPVLSANSNLQQQKQQRRNNKKSERKSAGVSSGSASQDLASSSSSSSSLPSPSSAQWNSTTTTLAPNLLVTNKNLLNSDGVAGVAVGVGVDVAAAAAVTNSNITNLIKSNTSNKSRQDRSNPNTGGAGSAGGPNPSGRDKQSGAGSDRKPSTLSLKKQCSMSEYTCTNGRCVPLNKFCDLINDCGDGSDEPRFCSRCNRTYYGDIGLTYSLELHRPKQDRIPFICMLTISAGGGKHGDIVQVTLDSFTVGRFTSYIQDGCPDGSLSMSEATRSPIGGMWCGSSWGPVMFYSETRALIFTVKLNRLARDQSGYNFDFRIRYKVLSKDSSVTRYGGVKIEDVAPWFNLYTANSSTILVNAGNRDNSGYGLFGGFDNNIGGLGSNSIAGMNQPIYNTTTHMSGGAPGAGSYPDTNIFSTYMNEKGKEMHRAVDKADPSNREYRNFTEPIYYLGDLIQGTYCSRIYSNCDRKVCRLQSPNYPGIYPRNLTCYYAIRQHDIPHGKHALITIKQPKGNLIWIATPPTQHSGQNKNFVGGGIGSGGGGASGVGVTGISDKDKKYEPKIKTWSDCDFIQDYVTIYDGYTTRDPVILKFCGGGQSVPASTSSGPEILVEFTTSPYGTFIGSTSQLVPLHGFQLEVEVTFVDALSPTFVKNKKLCEFWIRGNGRGVLENPKHSLAPNTTCLYHLQGTGTFFRTYDFMNLQRVPTVQEQRAAASKPIQTSRFKVWISLLKFNLQPPFGTLDDQSAISLLAEPEDCSGMLRIWDGPLREPPTCQHLDCERDLPKGPVLGKSGTSNFTNIMARYCKGSVPRTCDRANINETHARPCTISESYVSTGDSITLELKNADSTALRPLDFKLRYEFVDLHQDGLPYASDHECSRKFVSSLMERKDPAIFRSIRNVFMFGRGGTTNLKCVYRFEAQRGERVRIKIKRVNTGRRECSSRVDEEINRSYCYGNSSIRVEIFERPYPDSILLPRACLCNSSDLSHLPVEYTSTGRELEVHFTASNMTSLEDPDTVNFEGIYEFVKGPLTCKDGRRKYGPSGTIDMTFGDIECRTRPWVIEPSNGNKYLYVRTRAIFLKKINPKFYQHVNASLIRPASYRCETKSRVVLTSSEGLTIIACPLSEDRGSNDFVEMFSAGWGEPPIYGLMNRSKAISIEFLRPTNGDFYFTWMEMVPRPPLGLVEDCKYKCSEIEACVNASVWCDGVIHCPSGDDESFLQCSSVMKLPAELLATICIVLLLICFGLMAYTYRKLKRKLRGSSVLQTRLKSLSSMDTAVFDEKDVIC